MRKSKEKMEDSSSVNNSRGVFSRLRTSSLKKPGNRSKARSKQNEAEATTTTLLVVLGFVFCYAINYFFICYYFAYLVIGDWPFAIANGPWDVLETLWMMGMNVNSIFNPIIYLFRNTAFKTELLKMKRGMISVCHCGEDARLQTVIKGTSSGSTSYMKS